MSTNRTNATNHAIILAIMAIACALLASSTTRLSTASASPGDPPTSADISRIVRAIEANTAAIREAGRACR